MESELRILALVEGDPSAPLTLSGVPGFLLDALDRRFDVVGRVDYGLTGLRRAMQAAATFRPRRADWVSRFHLTPRAYRQLTKTLARRLTAVEEPFDVAFQVHGWVGGQPRPYVLYVDQTRTQVEAGWPQWLPMGPPEREEGRRLERSMYRGAEHIFTMGHPARESLVADYGIQPEKVTVTGGGVNFSSLPAPRAELPREPRVLFIGREFKRKGGEVLLQAFRQLRERIPTARLDIVGPLKRFTEPAVFGHGLVVDRRHIAELYTRARVVCAPPLYEPWGFVFLEAMAHGVPCVGTTVQSVPDILHHGEAGVLVPPGDPAALAEALVTLLQDDALASRLAAAGRSRVEERYTWDRVVQAMASTLASAGRKDA